MCAGGALVGGWCLVGELAVGVPSEQRRADLGQQLLSDQLHARLQGVDDLKYIVYLDKLFC